MCKSSEKQFEQCWRLKVSKFQKQIILFSIFPKTKQLYSRILAIRIEGFCSFFGRIENKKICFRDLLTFKNEFIGSFHQFASPIFLTNFFQLEQLKRKQITYLPKNSLLVEKEFKTYIHWKKLKIRNLRFVKNLMNSL